MSESESGTDPAEATAVEYTRALAGMGRTLDVMYKYAAGVTGTIEQIRGMQRELRSVAVKIEGLQRAMRTDDGGRE